MQETFALASQDRSVSNALLGAGSRTSPVSSEQSTYLALKGRKTRK